MLKRYARLIGLISLILASSSVMVSAQTSGSDNCPPSQFADGGLGVVTPGDANKVRTQPSTSADMIGRLAPGDPFEVLDFEFVDSTFTNITPVCADGYLWIRIASQNITGWTVEIPADGTEPFLVPYEEPDPVKVGTKQDDGSIRVDEGGIAFTVPAGLQIDYVTMQPQVGSLNFAAQCSFPNYVMFVMWRNGDDKTPWFELPRLEIYPFNLNESIYNYWAYPGGQDLEALMAERPDLSTYNPTNQLPWPPMCGAVALFNGAPQYLSFPNGDGFRFVTEIAQADITFSGKTQFTYEYSGLTSDKNFLVAFQDRRVKVPASAIPPASLSESAGYNGYLAQFAANLAGVPNSQYDPDLGLLDSIISSLTLGDTKSVMRLIP